MGRVKLIETPEKLYTIFEEYKAKVLDNPRVKIEYVGKDGYRVETPLRVPFTNEGFLNFCQDNYSDVHHYFDNPDKRYDDYRAVCSRIKREIRQDQIEGGMVGQYNASITQRLNALKETSEATVINRNIEVLNIDPLDDSTDNGTT